MQALAELLPLEGPCGTGVELRGHGSRLVCRAPVVIGAVEADGSGSTEVAVGYQQWHQEGERASGAANVLVGGTHVIVEDDWQATARGFVFSRGLTVSGAGQGGIDTEVRFCVEGVHDLLNQRLFVPGVLYGDPLAVNPSGIGSLRCIEASDRTGFWVREDRLPIPLIALHQANGQWVSVLAAAPERKPGGSDAEALNPGVSIGDGKVPRGFGLLDGPKGIFLVYVSPGREGPTTYAGNTYPDGQVAGWHRRYLGLKDGASLTIRLLVLMGAPASFTETVRQCTRVAWRLLKPRYERVDIDLARRHLLEVLFSQVAEVDGKAGLPMAVEAVTGTVPDHDRRALMGWLGRNTDVGFHLLQAGREPGGPLAYASAGRKILDSFAALPAAPPVQEGFWLTNGAPADHEDGVYLRCLCEGGKALALAYRQGPEAAQNGQEWLRWCTQFAEWLLSRQSSAGGFPRRLDPGYAAEQDRGQSSYQAIEFLVELWSATNDRRYLDAAARAGDLCWSMGQRDGSFVGGTIDNPEVADKEAATLSAAGYLAMFEATAEPKWLSRAQAAADVAETWIYLWDLEMPQAMDRHWKPGVRTVGLQLIATGHSLVDEYMAFDVGTYASLWKHTGDSHYRDVARLLLHATKAMLALPDREFDLLGSGWQQEHWSLAPPRGNGLHRMWLPWVSCAHLQGIESLKRLDAQGREALT